MPTVMIIDDEVLIRKGIVSIIGRLAPQWQVSECIDAASALESLNDSIPDLMVIDINMPGISGLELAEQLKLQYPEILKIILTGHDKFSYVQSALRSDVLDYLLKPVIREELIGALLKAEQVLALRSHKKEQEQAARQLQLEKSLEALFSGTNIDEKVIKHLLVENGWSLRGDEFAILILIGNHQGFQLNQLNLAHSMELFKAQFTEIYDSFSFFVDPKHFILLSSGKQLPTDRMGQWWSKQWLSAESEQPGKSDMAIIMGVSPAFKSMAEMPEVYWKTVSETYKVELDQEKLYMIYRGKAWFEQQKRLISALEMNDFEAIQLFLRDWFKELKQKAVIHPSMMLYQLFHFFLLILVPLLNQIDSKLSLFLREEIAAVLTQISSPGSSVTFFAIMEQFELKLLQFQTPKNDSLEQNKVIDIVKEHIGLHYGDKELKLEALSKIVHMNANYLSDLFKEITGENYIDYLTQIRMSHAKRLLRETHLKTYEISDQVGYTTAKYFCKLFRRLFGVTPTDYRNRAE